MFNLVKFCYLKVKDAFDMVLKEKVERGNTLKKRSNELFKKENYVLASRYYKHIVSLCEEGNAASEQVSLPLLAFIDLYWPLLTFIGLYWPLLSSHYYRDTVCLCKDGNVISEQVGTLFISRLITLRSI